MSVSVSMPQLGESVTEGTVTRWLKKEGERVEADEPLLEVSTDKVDTEIPSPVSGILRGITVAEDETVAVGAELAVIDETAAEGDTPTAPQEGEQPAAPQYAEAPQYGEQPAAPQYGEQPAAPQYGEQPAAPQYAEPPAAPQYADAPQYAEPPAAPQYAEPPAAPAQPEPAAPAPAAQADPGAGPSSWQAWTPPPRPGPAPAAPPAPAQAAEPPAPAQAPAPAGNGPAPLTSPGLTGADGPYVTPLVRKLAAEHGVDLAALAGTGVGGRIRKQDVLDAARATRGPAAGAPPQAASFPPPGQLPQAPPSAPPAAQPAQAPAAQPAQAPPAAQPAAAPAAGAAPSRPAVEPSALRGTTEPMSRARQLIARRMVESLQTSAQLTTVVEADVTAIARLRDRAKADFEAREGVKLSFLPFFALAAVEALKTHPRLNAVIDANGSQVTYHDAEHLGVAVDTERGLMVPVIRNAGDLNVGGLARKIADLAQRTRGGQVSPDDLAGGTFTLTNTGSRGALFDTPIINQPQVAILGTGTVVKRPVVMEDPALGEVITVRSMVYLALTYDHRLVDGADAARFLVTVKARLEEGAFEAELGL
jgi:pyruvate dehydrogenase E2 component (dihydrolipoamide acetyltransferase)